MKKSVILQLLIDQAESAKRVYPSDYLLPVLTTLRGTASGIFRFGSYEHSVLDSYVQEYLSRGFVGPLPLGVSHA